MPKPSLTILVPARNEAGNIPRIIQSIPVLLGAKQEVVFVEGNSSDATWDAIQQQVQSKTAPYSIRAYQQAGKGKAEAVRLGCKEAANDLIIIFDADLTVDASYIQTFYDAYCNQEGKFIIGNRFFYPMEKEAMRPLNYAGNKVFAFLLSYVLRTTIPDSLCGMKMFAKSDWEQWQAWMAKEIGTPDPFGDFELIFPAAALGVGIKSIPVPYKARTYGKTNIRRFRDGWLLLKMTLTGYWRIRLGRKRNV